MVKIEIDLSNKCRACLSEEEEMHYLFGNFDQGLTLAEILVANTSFQASDDDGFPPFLCESCTTVLVDFHNFKAVYQENENYLKSLLTISDVEIQDSSTKSDDSGDENSFNKGEQEEVPRKKEIEEMEIVSNDVQIEEKENKQVRTVEEMVSDLMNSDKEQSDNESGEFDIEVKEIETYTCKVCGDSFLHKTTFISHMSESHQIDDIKNYDDFLTKSFVNKDLEEGNKGYNKIFAIPPSKPLRSRCKFCKQDFDDSQALKEHMKVHKTHICDQCGARFTKKTYLLDHYERHDSKRRHVCQFCGKAFQRRTVLVKHRRIHTHPRQNVCELCGKRFNDRGTLKTHIMLLHTKDRKFKCELCDLSFPLKATLNKHVRRHSEDREKEYVCEFCNMGYRDKSSLNRHVLVKHNEKHAKATCHFCGKQYTTNTNLKKHQRKYHGCKEEETENVIVNEIEVIIE